MREGGLSTSGGTGPGAVHSSKSGDQNPALGVRRKECRGGSSRGSLWAGKGRTQRQADRPCKVKPQLHGVCAGKGLRGRGALFLAQKCCLSREQDSMNQKRRWGFLRSPRGRLCPWRLLSWQWLPGAACPTPGRLGGPACLLVPSAPAT